MALVGVLFIVALSGELALVLAAAAAALILIPEALYALAAGRIIHAKRARLGRALGARALRLGGIIVFLALGLRLIEPGAGAAAAVWMLTVLVLVLTPAALALARGARARRGG